MKRYDTQDLSNPDTYQNDPELEKLCRQTINGRFRELGYETRAAAREAVFGGKHPEWVAGLVNNLVANQVATDKQIEENTATITDITPPEGYSLQIDDQTILIKGPYCENLAKRLYRQDAYWDGKKYDNRRCFVFPLKNAKSLDRIFKNWLKNKDQRDKKTAEAKEKSRQSDIKRWLEYVEKSAQEGRIYQNGVDKLNALGIAQHPELNDQLSELIAKAKAVQAEKKATASFGKSWTAERTGFCSKCDSAVAIGDKVHYRYQNGSKHLEHVDCQVAKESKDRKEAEAPFKLSGGSGYGCQGWTEGEVIRSRDYDRENNGHPEFLYIVEAHQEYVKYDGMSFGVGDESGYVYWARCREATDEEAAPLKAKIEEVNRKRQAKSELEAMKDQIRKEGEYPEGSNQPEGDRLFDIQDIYGGGDWFVVGPEYIWYVRNNGMDGDNWSNNNVRTGGAGAIGWRVPYSVELAEKLNRLKKAFSTEPLKPRPRNGGWLQ